MRNKLGIREAAAMGAFLVAVVLPGAAWGLGLGQIQSDTRIGQPFEARIPILAATSNDLQGLSVGLADPAAYQQAGISEPGFLFDLKFSVKQGPGGPYVLVTSQQPTRLPFLNLMVHASWSSGEVTRQYTVLLNPPVFAAGTSGAAVSVPSAAPVAQQPAPAQRPTVQTLPLPPRPSQTAAQPAVAQQPQPEAVPTVEQAPTPAPQQVHSYGPVVHGDTLWALAHRLRPDTSISINQMMIALYRANPQAFVGNINRLKAGYVLQVPSRSEIESISTTDATQNVARQNSEWQQARSAVAVQPQPQAQAQPTAVAVPATVAQASAGAAPQQVAQAATGAGRVLLTTPEVTASQAAAAPGTATGKVAAGAVGAAGAAVAAAGTAGGGAAGTGASVGGPAKIQSSTLANLAAAKTSAAGATAATTKSAAQPASKAVNTANAAHSVNSVNTVSSPPEPATPWWRNWQQWEDWLATPPGWIAIGGVVLVLLAVLLALRRRRRGASGGDRAAPKRAAGVGAEASAADAEETEAAPAGGGAGSEEESEQELGTETYIGGPAPELDQGDPVAEAEFHAGYGEYDEAVRILRAALTRQPERDELRRKLLEVLFAAGDAQAFRAEAETYRGTVDEGSEQWSDVAVMGRRLLPNDELFAESGAVAAAPAQAQAQAETESLDFDMELDRLSGTASADASQDEFERTMDELSTFIETYVPGSGETPLELQLPPQDEKPAPEPESVDDALEFTPDEGDDVLEAPASGQTPAETTAGEGEEPLSDENVVDTKLDLARAYIDMGDPESARSVLEEVVDEGDETQRGEAQRLLDSLS